MTTASANVTTALDGGYALGYTNFEHDRLIRQARRIRPYTDCCWHTWLAHRDR